MENSFTLNACGTAFNPPVSLARYAFKNRDVTSQLRATRVFVKMSASDRFAFQSEYERLMETERAKRT